MPAKENWKRIVCAALVSAVIGGCPAFAEESADYTDDIDFVTENGIMQGDENGELRLSDTITRAEFVKMLMTAAGEDAKVYGAEYGGDISFADVGEGHWAQEPIETAAGCGHINGYEDGSFRPEDNVTYVQAVKMVLAVCGMDTEYTGYPFGYIEAAMDNGILDGIDFEPDAAITRGDAARLMYNVYRAVSDGTLVFERSNTVMHHKELDNGYTESYGMGLFKTEETVSYPEQENTLQNAPIGSSGSAAGGSGGGGGSAASSDMSYGGTFVVPNYNPYISAEEYESYEPNAFKRTSLSPLSTFSIDTDTASYSNMRRFVLNGSMPMDGAIRTEELINYFSYDTPETADGAPIGVTAEITDCPWSGNKLARITVAGREAEDTRPSNLVFLIDVSGSMASYNKLPLIRKALLILLDELGEDDTVSIVTYAGTAQTLLEPTGCGDRETIINAVDSLESGGGTYGAAGLELAYELIEENRTDGNNRIILCSDGDFNIGPSSADELEKLITEKRRGGIYLTTMGFGMGNYKDARMELMADCGNGSYYYIDNMREAKRVFADELDKTLYTVAEDVKLQVEFNPVTVSEYRLVGYENRQLAAEDFADDSVDAGELGAGGSVTAVYELIMNRGEPAEGGNDDYRYQTAQYNNDTEAFDVKVRYKEPGGGESKLMEFPILNDISEPDDDSQLAAAAAMLGLKLNGVISVSYDDIAKLAESSMAAEDANKVSERCEFLQLVEIMKYIDR